MHFPLDTADHSSRHAERQVYLPPVRGDSAMAVGADRDESMFGSTTVDSPLAPFNHPVRWYDDCLSLEETEGFIPIVERRLELNAARLANYPQQLEAAKRDVEDDERQIAVAYEAVRQLVLDDDARLGGPPQGVIMTHAVTVGPDVWLASRGRYVRDTHEWKQLQALKMRTRRDADRRRQEHTELQRKLAEEREMTGTLQSRLYHLREHATLHRESESLA